MNQSLKDRLTDATLRYLTHDAGYTDYAGNRIGGNSVSYVIECVSSDVRLAYRGGRRANVSEEMLEECGFRIIQGRNDRNQRCRVVTI